MVLTNMRVYVGDDKDFRSNSRRTRPKVGKRASSKVPPRDITWYKGKMHFPWQKLRIYHHAGSLHQPKGCLY